MLLIVALIALMTPTGALRGYGCGAGNLNLTTLSLLDVGECEMPAEKVEVERKYIQLLQINDYLDTMGGPVQIGII